MTDRQTDGQADKLADRQMGRQADGCVDDNWIGGNKKREVRVGYEQLLKFRLYAHLHRVWYYWHFDTEIYHYVSSPQSAAYDCTSDIRSNTSRCRNSLSKLHVCHTSSKLWHCVRFTNTLTCTLYSTEIPPEAALLGKKRSCL